MKGLDPSKITDPQYVLTMIALVVAWAFFQPSIKKAGEKFSEAIHWPEDLAKLRLCSRVFLILFLAVTTFAGFYAWRFTDYLPPVVEHFL